MIISQNLLWDFLATGGNCSVMRSGTQVGKMHENCHGEKYERNIWGLILGLNQHYQHLQHAPAPEPEPGVISHPCTGKKENGN